MERWCQSCDWTLWRKWASEIPISWCVQSWNLEEERRTVNDSLFGGIFKHWPFLLRYFTRQISSVSTGAVSSWCEDRKSWIRKKWICYVSSHSQQGPRKQLETACMVISNDSEDCIQKSYSVNFTSQQDLWDESLLECTMQNYSRFEWWFGIPNREARQTPRWSQQRK